MTLGQQFEQRGQQRGEQIGAYKAAVQVALKMLKDSMPLEMIQNYSGLTKEEILKLQQTIHNH